MEKQSFEKFISQIKKYDLTGAFNNIEEFEKWVKNLSKKQVKNFNDLNINPKSILFPQKLMKRKQVPRTCKTVG